MKIVVQDANILIDLLDAKLLDCFFDLPYESHSTDFVLAEIRTHKLNPKQSSRIECHSLSEDELAAVLGIQRSERRLSIPDCSVFWLVQSFGESAFLLTGDMRLRSYCEQHGIDVRGILWVFDELINHEIVVPSKMVQLLKDGRFRVPKYELEKRISLWGK